jgi:hypothetical protein
MQAKDFTADVVFCDLVSTVAGLVSGKLRPTGLSAAEDVRGIDYLAPNSCRDYQAFSENT